MATRKTKVTTVSTPAMYSFDVIEHGKLMHYQRPVIDATPDRLLALVKADSELDSAIIGSLFTGKKLAFNSGSAFVKAVNDNRAKGAKAVTKNDVKAAYDKLQAYARIIEINSTPLQSAWDKFTADKIAEREVIKLENTKLEAKGEKAKALPRITAPTVNGILAMIKPAVDVDHLASALKSMKTAYNHFLELKGKQAQQDSEKLAALIVSNGGEI